MKLFYLSRLIFLWSNESLNEKIILFSREIEEEKKKGGTKREQFETRTTIFPQLRSVPAFRVSIPFHSSLVLKSRGEQSCYQRTTPLFPSPRYSSSNNAASFQSPDLVHTFAYSWARVPRLATTRRGKIFWTPSEKKNNYSCFHASDWKLFSPDYFYHPSFLPSSPYFLFSLITIGVFSTHSSTKLPWKRSTNSMEEEKKLRLIDRIKINSLGAAQLRRVSKRMDKDLCGPATPGKEGRERGRRYRMESLDTAGTMA